MVKSFTCPECRYGEMVIVEVGPGYVVYECALCGHRIKLVGVGKLEIKYTYFTV